MQTNYSALDKFKEIRKYSTLILIGIVLFLGYQMLTKKETETTIEYDTALIQQQIKNVGKLVVTEGHFAEVITYKDSKKYMGNLISFDKKAIVVINADVTVGYDLGKIQYDINENNKTINIVSIPAEEVKISPDFKYYDTESSTFNEFTGTDYNKINKTARENLAKKINASNLKTNAKSRLVTELSKILLVANNSKWQLLYQGKPIETEKELQVVL
jgi:predicted nucleic acid-binding protein